MVTKASTRFIIRTSKERCVLSAFERKKSGDLVLKLRSRGLRRDFGSMFSVKSGENDDKFSDLRCSVHSSMQSKEEINVITIHSVLEDGTTKTWYQYTSAIKQFNEFTPIYIKRCESLEDSVFDITNEGGLNIDLGTIDPILCLVFAIFVGPTGKSFELESDPQDFNVQRVDFTIFSLIILWTFIPIFDQSTGIAGFITSVDGKGPSLGLSADLCVCEFNKQREKIKQDILSSQADVLHGAEDEKFRRVLPFFRYFKDGSSNSVEMHNFFKSIFENH